MPEFIVQFEPVALQKAAGEVRVREEYLQSVLACSKPGTLAVDPLFPGVKDKEMQAYFRVHAVKGTIPRKMAEAVGKLDGVLSAYEKADAAPPRK